MLEKTGTAALQTYYLHRDYLGSITQISNNNGNLAAEYSYDAWGRMRNPSNWLVYSQSTQSAMVYGGRGYTGHEQLNQFGLINMNARLYDPLLGRFLAPDPFVGSGLTNDYNRYIYGRNNPMMYTDPDGKFAWLAFLAGTLIVEGISYLAGVRDTGWKDWTPRINTVIGGGYSGYNGYYGGISFDGGNHFSNLGWKDGLTAGTSHDGVTQMSSVIQSFNPMQKVVEREQEMRQDDAERKGGWIENHLFFEFETRFDYGLQADLHARALGFDVLGGYDKGTKPFAQLEFGYNHGRSYFNSYDPILNSPTPYYNGITDPIRDQWSAGIGILGAKGTYYPSNSLFGFQDWKSETICCDFFNTTKQYNTNGVNYEKQWSGDIAFDLSIIFGFHLNIRFGYYK